ncbi:hypothetical protein ACQPZZ_39020 [Microbispora sp. CA-135349]|uniref:hypothetical protein n=1 Tax=Microbispora sp. CA-135349 TaxID=3239953 RepID=UPI003D94943B
MTGSGRQYCILPPFTIGTSQAGCLGGLELDAGWQFELTSQSFALQGRVPVCEWVGDAFDPPQDAWRYDETKRSEPAVKLLMHDSVTIGGHRASHVRWKYSCRFMSVVSEMWYVPDLQVTVIVAGMTDRHRASYLKILSTVDFSKMEKLLRTPTLREVD